MSFSKNNVQLKKITHLFLLKAISTNRNMATLIKTEKTRETTEDTTVTVKRGGLIIQFNKTLMYILVMWGSVFLGIVELVVVSDGGVCDIALTVDSCVGVSIKWFVD